MMHGVQAGKGKLRACCGRNIIGVEVLDVQSGKTRGGDHTVACLKLRFGRWSHVDNDKSSGHSKRSMVEGLASRNCAALVLKGSSPHLLKSPRLMTRLITEGTVI